MTGKSTLRSIGQVLSGLKGEFPDVSISKIRFLESEGLLAPQRAPSGYRRYADDDVRRLRYILTAQRDHYLPLRVIRDHLELIDAGQDPPLAVSALLGPGGTVPSVPGAAGTPSQAVPGQASAGHRNGLSGASGPGSNAAADGPGQHRLDGQQRGSSAATVRDGHPSSAEPGSRPASGTERSTPRSLPMRLSRVDLLKASGLSESALAELERIQVIQPRRGSRHYGREALALAVAAKRLAVYGIDSRHLRAFKMAADREIGLVEQAIAPHVRRSKNGAELTAEVTQLIVSVHAALVRVGMDR